MRAIFVDYLIKMDSPKKFRVNPIEVVIFSIVFLMLFHSVYNLFYDKQILDAGPLSAALFSDTTPGRMPATLQSFQNIEITCIKKQETEMQASKVRLTGPICGLREADSKSQQFKTQILNQTNNFEATVFTDVSAGKFSTDYIPLAPGKNQIFIKFDFENNKIIQELIITKN